MPCGDPESGSLPQSGKERRMGSWQSPGHCSATSWLCDYVQIACSLWSPASTSIKWEWCPLQRAESRRGSLAKLLSRWSLAVSRGVSWVFDFCLLKAKVHWCHELGGKEPPLAAACLELLLKLFPQQKAGWGYGGKSGVPNLWGLMPDKMTWSWCNNNNRNKGRNQCSVLEASPNHPLYSWSLEKLSSMKPVPGAKMLGGCWGLGWQRRVLCFNPPTPFLWYSSILRRNGYRKGIQFWTHRLT